MMRWTKKAGAAWRRLQRRQFRPKRRRASSFVGQSDKKTSLPGSNVGIILPISRYFGEAQRALLLLVLGGLLVFSAVFCDPVSRRFRSRQDAQSAPVTPVASNSFLRDVSRSGSLVDENQDRSRRPNVSKVYIALLPLRLGSWPITVKSFQMQSVFHAHMRSLADSEKRVIELREVTTAANQHVEQTVLAGITSNLELLDDSEIVRAMLKADGTGQRYVLEAKTSGKAIFVITIESEGSIFVTSPTHGRRLATIAPVWNRSEQLEVIVGPGIDLVLVLLCVLGLVSFEAPRSVLSCISERANRDRN